MFPPVVAVKAAGAVVVVAGAVAKILAATALASEGANWTKDLIQASMTDYTSAAFLELEPELEPEHDAAAAAAAVELEEALVAAVAGCEAAAAAAVVTGGFVAVVAAYAFGSAYAVAISFSVPPVVEDPMPSHRCQPSPSEPAPVGYVDAYMDSERRHWGQPYPRFRHHHLQPYSPAD